MNINWKSFTPIICAGAALLCAAPAGAMSPQQDQWQSNGQWQDQSAQRQRNAQFSLEPQGWVRVAYDFDQDNRIDAVEWIFMYDLEQARASSQNRMRQQQGMQQGMQPSMQQGRQPMMRPGSQQQASLQGRIQSMHTVNLVGIQNPHVVAKVETSDGRVANVDLGPRNQLQQVDLQTGDRIQVRGVRGTINQKPMLMARQIQTNGQTVSIDRPRSMRMMPTQGEVVRLRSMQAPSGIEHVFATMRLQNGRFTTIDLGPKQFVQQQAGVQQGDQIAVLATPKRTRSGNLYLQAHRLNIDGQTFNVAQATQREMQAQGQGVYGYTGDDQAGQQAKQVTIVAEDMEFSPSQITARPGETVRIRLRNQGSARHSIEFELPNAQPSLQQPLQPDESGTVTFTAPSEPGQYTFYCPVADHKERGMKGTLIVRQSSSSSSQ